MDNSEKSPTGQGFDPSGAFQPVDSTPEFETIVTLKLSGKAFNKGQMEHRWNAVVREILRVFGPTGYEVRIEPNWEERGKEEA